MPKNRTNYIIERKSPFTGKIHQMEIWMNPNDFIRYKTDPDLSIQEAFPYLTANEREFIRTGIHPDEWVDAWAE